MKKRCISPAAVRWSQVFAGTFLLLLCLVPWAARAAVGNIFIVTDQPQLEVGTNNLAGYLRSLGYTVTVDEGNGAGAGPSRYRGALDATKTAYLESFDLVIVHRATASDQFLPAAAWNNLNVPLLSGSVYLSRNNPARWDWATATIARQVVSSLTFAAPTHPIIAGLNPDLFNVARDVDLFSTTNIGNGRLIATIPGSGAAIATWDAPGFFLGSSGQTHVSRRVFFPFMRYHETDTATAGVFTDYSPNGRQLLANAVAYAMTGAVGPAGPTITDLVPASGTVSHPATNGIQFAVRSSQPVDGSAIKLLLNGSNVSAGLIITGDPTNRSVRYEGLLPETSYSASLTASNNLGATTVLFTFDTTAPDLTPPTVVAVSPVPSATLSNLLALTVTFSEPVTNIGASDLLINDLPAVGMTGSGAVYTFEIEQPPFGPVQISWDPAATIADRSPAHNLFNKTGPGATWNYALVDSIPPTVLSRNPPVSATVQSLTQIEVVFTEAVQGVDADDLLINGVAAATVSGLAQGPYLFQFLAATTGLVTVAWANNHGITDLAIGSNALATTTWAYTVDPNYLRPELRINEFLSASLATNGLRDEFGNIEDWIELHNYGATPINLAGFSLTDQANLQGKWIFPSMVMTGGQYLVVFASGLDRKAVGGTNRLHTNFKLNADGDYLALFDAQSPRVALTEFDPEFPEQRNDYSFGYDSTNQLRYFRTPTPGAANGNSTVLGVVPQPHFNVARGFFDAPFTLVLGDELPGATIRYTLDGSQPTAANGQTYANPLSITNSAVVRAAAFLQDYLPSKTETHTYLFLDQVIRQSSAPPGYPVGPTVMGGYPADYEMDPEIINDPAYAPLLRQALTSLPVISVVIKIDDMFGPVNGIYTHAETRGVQWEKPCSLEFILPNGASGFQVDAGIQMQGNANRNANNQPKHAFRVSFKGDYGPSKLNYQMFPDSPVDLFDTLVLRADYNNSWLHWDPSQRLRGARVRDGFVKDSMRAMGGLASHNRYVHLYINGLYWGIYDPTERPDKDFAASYLGGSAEEFDVMNEGAVKDGNITAYNTMLGINNLEVNSQYALMQQYLDMTQFIDYMLLHFWAANHDWGLNKNWYAVRRRAPGEGYKYVPWDGERTLEDQAANEVIETDVPSGLHTKLLANPEYRLAFADRVHKHFFNNGALTPAQAIARWNLRTAEMTPAMVAESARWGDYRRDVAVRGAAPLFTFNTHFVAEQNRMVNQYFPIRSGNVLNQLRAANLYPNVVAASFNQHGGPVARGFALTISAPAGVIYYTTDGSDPRVPITSAVAPGAQVYSGALPLNNSVVVKSRVLSGGTWSALNEAVFTVDALRVPLRITEIMYNPEGGDAYEFVEIQNAGNVTLNIGNYYLEGVTYLFPVNTILLPGQIIILGSAISPAAFAGRYPGVNVFGRFGGNLGNGGERLAIKDSAGRTIVSVDFDDERGWPASADGAGRSLELIDADANPDEAANWRSSAAANGTPGQPTAPSTVPSLVLNELLADNLATVENAGTYPDWIELYNGGASEVDLAGWSLTDDSDPRKFVFPSNTFLPAGGFLVVWCDAATNLTPGLHTDFALDRTGETVLLYDAASNRVDAISFGLQLTDRSIGRVGGAWQLNVPTPNGPNMAASTGNPTNVVINEWLSDPISGQDDWVELFNRHSSLPIALTGLYLSTSNGVSRLESLSYLEAGGFLQLFADQRPGPDHVDFRLAGTGGFIRVHDQAGVVFEQINYGLQTEGVSQGRLPDGSASITSFVASASPGASNFLFTYSGPLLHEVSALNVTAVPDSMGRVVDWVELHNPTGTAFDLAGMRLSDTPGNPAQWFFPAGAALPANGFLVVWFDGQRPASVALETDLNTGRSLDGNSGGVYLFNAAGNLVDSVVYGFQIGDQSIGVQGNGWKLLVAPTPGAANAEAAPLGLVGALRINEWLANPSLGDDWFELYNGNDIPVSIGGLYLTDDLSIPGRVNSQIAPLSFVSPYGFIKVIADGNGGVGRNHVNFSLDADGEAIRLYGPNFSVIDSVYFGQQSTNSQGRLPDGANDVAFFEMPTPGAPNALSPGPPLIVEHPESQLVDEGETVIFRVRAVGQGTLHYQWRYNGNLIGNQTSTSLQLNAVLSEQQGEYSVVINNAFGSVTSAVAQLTIEGPPVFVVQPQSQVVVQGGTATFAVATRGTLPMGYRWRRGGTTILSYVTNSHFSTFRVLNAQLSDAGNYSVVLTNSVSFVPGVLSPTAVLTVLADGDQDGLPDVWEAQYQFNSSDPSDATLDSDGDGSSNQDEYTAGTDPRNAASYLRFEAIQLSPSSVLISFPATSNHTYSVQWSDHVPGGPWTRLANADLRSTNRVVTLTNQLSPEVSQRFYRLVAPHQP